MNLDGQSAAVHADSVEAAAYSDLFDAAPASLKARLGIDVQQHVGATLLIAPGLPTPMFNRAIGLGLAAAASDADVDALVQVSSKLRSADQIFRNTRSHTPWPSFRPRCSNLVSGR